jgi:hypothetical protein
MIAVCPSCAANDLFPMRLVSEGLQLQCLDCGEFAIAGPIRMPRPLARSAVGPVLTPEQMLTPAPRRAPRRRRRRAPARKPHAAHARRPAKARSPRRTRGASRRRRAR